MALHSCTYTIKHDIEIDTDEIINEFAAASPRRLELLFNWR